MDQGGQASSEDDPAELPPVSRQRSAALSESDHLQPREPVAALGAAQWNRKLVAAQLAAALGENRRSIGQARKLLLVAPSGESSDAAALWSQAVRDSGVSLAIGIGERLVAADFRAPGGRGGKVSQVSVERGPISSFGILRRGKIGPFRGPWKHPAPQTRLTVAFSGGQAYVMGRTRTR